MNLLTFPRLLSRPVGIGGAGGGVSVPAPTAYWKLDEESDGSGAVTRNASVSALHLTDNGTTPSAAGILGNAISCTPANSEFLSRASSTDLQTGDVDWTLAAWCKLNPVASDITLISKYETSINREYHLRFLSASNRFDLVLYNGSTQIGAVTANTFGALSINTWYFVVAQHDAATNKVYLGVNNVFDNANTTGAGGTSPAAFNVGARGSSSSFWNGLIDNVGWWKGSLLTTAQLTYLYNGGSGRIYPF